jgi:UDP-GlcNAc:undecaprenyl-phosphate GlcNAc-1-phosphate transferase
MNPANFFVSFSVTFLSIFALMPIANRLGLIDEPGGRKLHGQATPLVGGLGIYLGILGITLFAPYDFSDYNALLGISLLVLLVGMADDFAELSVKSRLGSQAIAAVLMCALANVQLFTVGDIFGFGDVRLGFMAVPFTIFATVGVINAVNMSDGVDGLSGGMVLIALAFLFLIANGAGNLSMVSFLLILIFSLLAFLLFNLQLPWKRSAMIYLGDAGSTFLGFVLAWLFIQSTQGEAAMMPAALAPWLLALPLMDTVSLLIRRPLRGLSPVHPGRDHLHHHLIEQGLSPGLTVALLLSVNTVIALAGYGAWRSGASEATLFYGFFLLFCIYLLNPYGKKPA